MSKKKYFLGNYPKDYKLIFFCFGNSPRTARRKRTLAPFPHTLPEEKESLRFFPTLFQKKKKALGFSPKTAKMLFLL